MGPHIWLDPNGSQLLPVITHTAQARDATEAATGAQSLTRWGSHFGARRGYYVTHVKLRLTWVALHLAGEETRCEGEGGWEREVVFPFFVGYVQNKKPHYRFYQSRCLPIHLDYTWWRMRNITSLQTSKAFCHFDCLFLFFPFSLPLSFISHHRPLVFTCQWLFAAFSSFLPSIYMSVAFTTWWCCVALKVICSVTVRPFYQLLLSSILASEYWWQWNQGAVKTF